MRLSQHADYALRVLMFLASTGNQSSVQNIAKTYGISHNHLMKVTQRLQALGYVDARRGRGGGIWLAKAPAEINVGQVVREFEVLTGFVECFSPATSSCPIASACGLQGALRLAVNDFLVRLDGYSLDDLVPDRRRMLDSFSRQLEAQYE